MNIPTIVLASASSARHRLLLGVGLAPVICPSHFDEDQIQISDPRELVNALALSKAETVVDQVSQTYPNSLILGCDSVLAFGGEIYGKPDSPADAIARWQKMRGRVGDLLTGHAIIDLTQNRKLIRCRTTQVYFADISDQQIEAYVATGEPMKCAGAFAIEGMGGFFIEKLEGCHTNVIGLSLPLLRQMFMDLDYDISKFWRQHRVVGA